MNAYFLDALCYSQLCYTLFKVWNPNGSINFLIKMLGLDWIIGYVISQNGMCRAPLKVEKTGVKFYAIIRTSDNICFSHFQSFTSILIETYVKRNCSFWIPAEYQSQVHFICVHWFFGFFMTPENLWFVLQKLIFGQIFPFKVISSNLRYIFTIINVWLMLFEHKSE